MPRLLVPNFFFQHLGPHFAHVKTSITSDKHMLRPFPVPFYSPDFVPPFKTAFYVCTEAHMTIKGNICWLYFNFSLSLHCSGYEPWPLFTFILENKINMSAVMYNFFPSTSFRLLSFHLPSARKIPNARSSVCAGRTAAVCQGSSVKANERIFMPNPTRWHKIAKGTVDAVGGCQARNLI